MLSLFVARLGVVCACLFRCQIGIVFVLHLHCCPSSCYYCVYGFVSFFCVLFLRFVGICFVVLFFFAFIFLLLLLLFLIVSMFLLLMSLLFLLLVVLILSLFPPRIIPCCCVIMSCMIFIYVVHRLSCIVCLMVRLLFIIVLCIILWRILICVIPSVCIYALSSVPHSSCFIFVVPSWLFMCVLICWLVLLCLRFCALLLLIWCLLFLLLSVAIFCVVVLLSVACLNISRCRAFRVTCRMRCLRKIGKCVLHRGMNNRISSYRTVDVPSSPSHSSLRVMVSDVFNATLSSDIACAKYMLYVCVAIVIASSSYPYACMRMCVMRKLCLIHVCFPMLSLCVLCLCPFMCRLHCVCIGYSYVSTAYGSSSGLMLLRLLLLNLRSITFMVVITGPFLHRPVLLVLLHLANMCRLMLILLIFLRHNFMMRRIIARVSVLLMCLFVLLSLCVFCLCRLFFVVVVFVLLLCVFSTSSLFFESLLLLLSCAPLLCFRLVLCIFTFFLCRLPLLPTHIIVLFWSVVCFFFCILTLLQLLSFVVLSCLSFLFVVI